MEETADALATLEAQPIYRFGPFVLDTGKSTLTRAGKRVHLSKKPLAVLAFLISHSPELATREQLLDKFWHKTKVYDEAVYRCLTAIRQALDDVEEPHQYIETQWRKGYRFIGELESRLPPGDLLKTTTKSQRPIRLYSFLTIVVITFISLIAWQESRAPRPITSIALLQVMGSVSDKLALSGLSYEVNHVIANLEGIRVVTVSSSNPTIDRNLVRQLGVDALLKTNLIQREWRHSVASTAYRGG